MNLLKRLANWLEDRTGLVKALRPPATHPVPKNEGWSWYYVLGSATLVSFLIQVFTGTLLSLSYIPSTSQAYQTLQFITQDALFGRVLRGMHFFGASAMILLMGLHAIRTYLMAAYKYPREMSWISSVANNRYVRSMRLESCGQRLGAGNQQIGCEYQSLFVVHNLRADQFIAGHSDVAGRQVANAIVQAVLN